VRARKFIAAEAVGPVLSVEGTKANTGLTFIDATSILRLAPPVFPRP